MDPPSHVLRSASHFSDTGICGLGGSQATGMVQNNRDLNKLRLMTKGKKALENPGVREKAATLVRDTTSAVAGTGAGMVLAATTGASAGTVAATAAASLAPFVLTTLLNVFSFARAWKERDALLFWNNLLRGSGADEEVTPEEIAGTILAHEEEPFVRETIYRSIRSVLDAVDPVVTVPLGLLAREYIGTEKVPDTFFRGFAQLLSQLSADDYQGLQQLMRRVSTSDLADNVFRVIVRDGKNFPQGFGFYIWKAEGERQGMYFAGTCKEAEYLLHLLKLNRFVREVTGAFGDTGGSDVYISRETATRLCKFLQ